MAARCWLYRWVHLFSHCCLCGSVRYAACGMYLLYAISCLWLPAVYCLPLYLLPAHVYVLHMPVYSTTHVLLLYYTMVDEVSFCWFSTMQYIIYFSAIPAAVVTTLPYMLWKDVSNACPLHILLQYMYTLYLLLHACFCLPVSLPHTMPSACTWCLLCLQLPTEPAPPPLQPYLCLHLLCPVLPLPATFMLPARWAVERRCAFLPMTMPL
jgi:hypothetical protein